MRGGNRRLQIPGVDDLALDVDLVNRAGVQFPDLLAVGGSAEVVVAGEDPDAPRRRQALCRGGEVLADLLAWRPFVEAGVLACVVDAVLPNGSELTP